MCDIEFMEIVCKKYETFLVYCWYANYIIGICHIHKVELLNIWFITFVATCKGRVTKLKSAKEWSLTILPPNLNNGLVTKNFKICTKNGKINTTKTGLNKDLVLGDPPSPPPTRWSKTILSRILILGPFPNQLIFQKAQNLILSFSSFLMKTC